MGHSANGGGETVEGRGFVTKLCMDPFTACSLDLCLPLFSTGEEMSFEGSIIGLQAKLASGSEEIKRSGELRQF